MCSAARTYRLIRMNCKCSRKNAHQQRLTRFKWRIILFQNLTASRQLLTGSTIYGEVLSLLSADKRTDHWETAWKHRCICCCCVSECASTYSSPLVNTPVFILNGRGVWPILKLKFLLALFAPHRWTDGSNDIEEIIIIIIHVRDFKKNIFWIRMDKTIS